MKTHKQLLFFLISVMVLCTASLVTGQADCVQGIDGYCDEACLEVDFDCARNPYHEGHREASLPESDDEYIHDNPYEHLLENDSFIVIGVNTDGLKGSSPKSDEKKEFLPLVFIAAGVVALLAIGLLIMHRLELKRGDDTELLKSMSFHINRLRSHGHSDESIKRMFMDKNHHPKMIEKAFKALERKP